MGSDIPKQFLPIGGKPVLMRTLERFRAYSADLQIILVLPEMIETTDSQRHGGWVRDGAGNLHQRNIKSRSTDFNGVFKLTDEIHQAGKITRRKLMATYNSGGLFSVSAGGFSPKHR